MVSNAKYSLAPATQGGIQVAFATFVQCFETGIMVMFFAIAEDCPHTSVIRIFEKSKKVVHL